MNRLAISAALAVAASGSAAHAEAPPSGVRAEYVVGYDTTHVGGVVSRAKGMAAGLRAGYDVPVNARLTLGVEGEVDALSSSATDTVLALVLVPGGGGAGPILGSHPTSPYFGAITATATMGRTITAGTRLTWWATPRAAIYLTGAYANQRVTTCVETAGFPCSEVPLTVSSGPSVGPFATPVTYPATKQITNRDGYRIGGGAQLRLGRFWFASAEYRYSHYSGNVSGSQVLAGLGLRL